MCLFYHQLLLFIKRTVRGSSVKEMFTQPTARLAQYLLYIGIALTSQVIHSQPTHSERIQATEQPVVTHAVAMHGQPKYPADFTHFDYANPTAPKGGHLKQATIGTFDSFNPFISKGIAADGLGYLYGSLTYPSLDEPFTHYGYIANGIEMPKDRSWVIFHINDKARFHDGERIEASDVKFSFDIRREKGDPAFQHIFAGVKEVIALDPHRVKFLFESGINRELALIVGSIEILPEHYWSTRDFGKSTLTPPIGSGAYKIKSFDPGKTITYERINNHWSESLALFKGRNNFDEVTYDYYLDGTVALEAFKAGQFDFRAEHNSKYWATLYQGPQFEKGTIIREELQHQQSAGMQGFIYNIRKPIFQDPVLREALIYALDYEWSNKNLFYDQYIRTRSYFQNTELAATGLPNPAELTLLSPYKKQLPKEVFTESYQPPTTNGSGKARKNLKIALKMLKKAGYTVRDNQLYSPNNLPIQFEFLVFDSGFERIVLPFIKNLAALGVQANLRKVDVTQFIERRRNFDFDMIVHRWNLTLSPGNEQRSYWHSSSADTPDSQNFIGIKDPVVDALVEKIITAPDRESLVNRSRALDRVLQWGFYVIPNWHVNYDRLAYNKKLQRPKTSPKYGYDINSWWIQ